MFRKESRKVRCSSSHTGVRRDGLAGDYGLTRPSAVDTLQLRGVDTQRFVKKIGDTSKVVMKSIASAIVTIIEY